MLRQVSFANGSNKREVKINRKIENHNCIKERLERVMTEDLYPRLGVKSS